MSTMITRTLIGTEVTAKTVNTATDEISRQTVLLEGSYEDPKATKLINKLKKALGEDVVIIKVESLAPANKLYGMPIPQFMAGAVELDPTTRKPL